MSCSYGSAIAGAPRCVRTQDPDAPLGSAMPVCGAPVAGGRGLRGRYCQTCLVALTTPIRSRPRVPSRAPNDLWLLPSPGELEELLG